MPYYIEYLKVHFQSNVWNNSDFWMFLIEVSSVHRGCIYLIKAHSKNTILKNLYKYIL